MRHLTPILIGLLCSCGGVPPGPGPGDAPMPAAPNTGGPVRVAPGTRNGSRLLIRYAVFADGAQLPYGLWDSKHNAPCAVGVGSAGALSIVCAGDGIPLTGMMSGTFQVGTQ